MSSISLRQAESEDIEALNKYLPRGNPDIHKKRYSKNEQGKGYYAIAWHGNKPVGNLFISWEGSETEPVKSQFPNCPHLIDMYVHPEYRNNHIATGLLEYAEARAREKGYQRIGLDIGDLSLIGYRIAHHIYTKHGYVDGGLDEYTISYIVDESGKDRVIKEKVRFLVKDLITDNFQ